jgi:hypothetical protein
MALGVPVIVQAGELNERGDGGRGEIEQLVTAEPLVVILGVILRADPTMPV